MPFNGVRNSWLTVARKRDLASLAASAFVRASSSVFSLSIRSVISRPLRRTDLAPSGPMMSHSIQLNQRMPLSVRMASSIRRDPSGRSCGGRCSTTSGSVSAASPPRRRALISSSYAEFVDLMRPAWSRSTTASGRRSSTEAISSCKTWLSAKASRSSARLPASPPRPLSRHSIGPASVPAPNASMPSTARTRKSPRMDEAKDMRLSTL